MKKRLLSLLLAVVLVAGCLPLSASAEMISYPVSGGSISFDLTNGTVYEFNTSGTTVEIPSEIHGVKVTAISAYEYTYITGIILPESVTFISDGFLYNCQKLEEIHVDSNNPVFSSQDGVLFDKAKTTLIACPRGKSGTYSIPSGITSIAHDAFCYSALNDVTIPGSVSSIGEHAFAVSALKTVVIPEGVTSIGNGAFASSSLTSVAIPLSVRTIGKGAFDYSSLKRIYYINGSEAEWSKIVFGEENDTLLSAPIFYTKDAARYPVAYDFCLYDDFTYPLLTAWMPESWSTVQVEYDYQWHSQARLDSFSWILRDSEQNVLFALLVVPFPLGYISPIGGTASTTASTMGHVYVEKRYTNDEYEHYYIDFIYPNSSPYAASDNSEAAVTYREMKSDIPAILRNMERNSDYIWDWRLSDSGFADVSESAYYSDAVKWAVDEGITSGTDELHFSPNTSCTRAQIVTFLWRAAGSPEPQSAISAFTDVNPDSYYEKAVRWAVENKITVGTSASKFSPNAKCTRGQSATFLWRAADCPESATCSTGFTDVKPDSYYEKAVQWAVENGITAGTSTTKFSPDAICSRGQIVTFLYRNMATK